MNHYDMRKIEGKATRGWKRMHLLSDLTKGKYVAQKLVRAGSQAPASQKIT